LFQETTLSDILEQLSAMELSGYPQTTSGTVRAVLAAPEIRQSQLIYLLIKIELPDGVHVYGEPAPPGYVPTSVAVSGPEGLVVEEPQFPPTQPLLVGGINEELFVFENDMAICLPLRYEANNTPHGEPITLELDVRYQSCDEIQCFTPVREQFQFELKIEKTST
jgi:DsbC/DsbD-like thiol-disulfide interchange protein